VAETRLITLEVAGGGPWDGHELSAEPPPDDWFDADGTTYRLCDRGPARFRGDVGVARYGWTPTRAHDSEGRG
jgi:hypothetical protein